MRQKDSDTLIASAGIVVVLIWLAVIGGGIWAACHFIAKYW